MDEFSGKNKRRSTVMVMLLLLFLTHGCSMLPQASPKTNIVSWYTADVNQDSKEELLAILKPDAESFDYLDTGEEYGTELAIYAASGYEIIDDMPQLLTEPIYRFDMSEWKPTKVQAGDINGDGITELAVCVYKTTKFNPVLAKRPFFYRLENDDLQPVWLGSRLSQPFKDYLMVDLDRDGMAEIVSIESTKDGNMVIAAYDWSGFGFELKAYSEEIVGTVCFTAPSGHLPKQVTLLVDEKPYQVILEDKALIIEEEIK